MSRQNLTGKLLWKEQLRQLLEATSYICLPRVFLHKSVTIDSVQFLLQLLICASSSLLSEVLKFTQRYLCLEMHLGKWLFPLTVQPTSNSLT